MLSGCFAHLKAFQDVLGTIQDAEIHARLVAELALPSCSASALRAPLALGRFLERSARRSQAARARYPALAAELASPAGRGRFAELFDELEAGPRR